MVESMPPKQMIAMMLLCCGREEEKIIRYRKKWEVVCMGLVHLNQGDFKSDGYSRWQKCKILVFESKQRQRKGLKWLNQ